MTPMTPMTPVTMTSKTPKVSRTPLLRFRSAALVGALLLGATSPAAAGTARLSFTHEHSTAIVEYRALMGFSPGNYSQEVSLGVPAVTASIFTSSIEIPDGVDVFVAIVAVDDSGVRSAPSNERIHFTASNFLGAPGQPQLLDQ